MILYIAVIGTIAAAASVGRLVLAWMDHKNTKLLPTTLCPMGDTSTENDQLRIRPDGSWTREPPTGWMNRSGHA